MISLFDVEVESWVIVFSYVQRPHWWDRFIRPGFNHCYCYKAIGDGGLWILYNPSLTHTQLELSHVTDAFDDPTTCRVLHFQPIRTEQRRPWFLCGHFTCVELCKAALSIYSWTTFTPYQLHRRLIAAGATELTHGQPFQETQTTARNCRGKGTQAQAAEG